MNSKKQFTKKAVAAVAALTLCVTSLGQTGVIGQSNKVSAASDNYAKLLQQSLFFYDANMCGTDVESAGLMQWRGNCHTTDEVPGGFHDAGDHAMFGLPQGFTASTIGWSYYEFKDAYEAVGTSAHFKTISDHFNTFFKKSTILDGSGNVTKFLYQKEDGDVDHGYWGPPEKQTGTRKMYWTSAGASDIAAEYAASLALSYLNFGNTEDLKYAKALYKFSTQHNQCATDGPNGFYNSKDCKDEQAWAAGWLYLATKEESYKNDCASKQTQYLGWVHGWENVGLGAACVYAHITNDWGKVNSYIGGQANGSGYYFLDKWGSARLNASMQFTALVATKNSSADYSAWCKGQMDYLLGQNPSNTCFVIGYASNSAKNPHHRAASGYQNYDELGNNNQTSPNGHTLVGALVGGPSDAGGTYQDVISDYVCNEVALDYNAGLVGSAAGLYSIYKSGTVESAIAGAKSNGIGGSVPGNSNPPATTTAPPTTQPPANNTTTKTTTTQGSSSSNGGYELQLNQKVDYSALPKDDKMIGWDWADFKIPSSEKITKVEVNISTSANKVGKWQGAFGTSTSVAPDYWAQSDEMEEVITGNKGTITWDIDSATSKIIQTQYGGQLKFGIWWIDCTTFTIDSIKVYTDGKGSSSVVTQGTTSTTTKAPASTTTQGSSSSNGGYTVSLNQKVDYSALPKDDKMIGWDWADFKIPKSEKITKVDINISTSASKIGKWQGAFGTSTSVAPDYWAQSDEMEEVITGNKGTISWNIDSATSKIIQTQYGGQLKFGIWWIDCTTFTIDSITVHTDGNGGSAATTTTTTKVTTAATTTTTKQTTTSSTTAGNTSSIKGDVDCNGSVTATDLASLMQVLVGTKTPSADGKKNADINNDGKINIIDLIMLKNKLS